MNSFNPLDLAGFFSPRSLAIVGVSRSPQSFGGLSFLDRLVEAGFRGDIYPINPKADEVAGIKSWPSLASLPEKPDLVMVAVPAPRVPGVLAECADLGIRHVHILTAGFGELGTAEGTELEEEIARIARENGLLVMGPNCMGPYSPAAGLTAWGAIPGLDGPVGVISQSGGITQRLTEYLVSLGVGVGKAASIGNATVLDSPDFLEYMGGDDSIGVIAMYLESVRDGRRLFEAASRVASRKPVVMLKGGRTKRGAATVSSHTGSMAGDQRLWKAFCEQVGIVSVTTMNAWVDAILACRLLPGSPGRNVFIVGGGGGNSVIYSDYCISAGLSVPQLSETSMAKIRSFVPAAGSIAGNPLDLWELYLNLDRLIQVLEIAYSDPAVDIVLVDRLIPRIAFHSPPVPDPTERVVEFLARREKAKPTIFVIDYDGGDSDLLERGSTLRARLCRAGVPAYPSVERAVNALSAWCGAYGFDKGREDSYVRDADNR